MPVTSSTIGGVNTWTFSGAVTDAQINTAWAALIVNGVYVINRAIYLDNTADLTGVTGGFLVDLGTQVNPGFILHTGRDKTKSTFRNFTFLQRTGLSVTDRTNFVRTWNGTALASPSGSDGLSQNGGGMVYGVPGNPGGGDPRFLNEMSFAGLEGVTIYSQEFTEQELQIIIAQTTQLKGITFEKAYGFPQIGTTVTPVNVTVYRSTQNTQSLAGGGLIPIRLFPFGGRYASVCYVDSYVTRNNADITTRLIDTFGANASNIATIMVLNNYTRESWFGASKTNIPVTASWAATNQMWGGILKKLRFVGGAGATIRAYDSRSTTAAQKCAFQETGTRDFLIDSLAPTTDAEGRISLVHIGALAQGVGAPITRYTNQRYTYQKFGQRVSVSDIDMTAGGDNDLSAFTPIIPVEQDGLVRSQATINAATSITSFQDLLEELHVLSLGLTGAASYAGAHGGNLFTYSGGILTTSFTTVNVDATAASKISYNSATNTLTIKASVLTDTVDVQRWNNTTGSINLQNGAAIEGVYQSSAGTSTIIELRGVAEDSSIYIGNAATGITTLFQADVAAGTYRAYFAPGVTAPQLVAREKYGIQRESEVIPLTGGLIWYQFVDIPDEGITEPSLATVNAYATIEDTQQLYDRVAAFRTTEAGIKLGNIVNRAGPLLQFGTYSGVIDQSATAAFDLTGDTITIKSSVFTGSAKYSTIIATPPATWEAETNEVIDVNIEDANGDSSVTIQAGSVSTFEIWKITDATDPDDYATGTLLDTVGPGKYRFIGANGFKIVIRDTVTNYRVVVEMEKGVYTAELFFGAQVQLAQSATVELIKTEVDLIRVLTEAIQGVGFTSSLNSLVALGTPLQADDYDTDEIAHAVWNEVLTRSTHNVPRSAGRRLRTLADTVVLIEGTGEAMSNAGGIGSITLPDASTVCIKQSIRIENQVRFVRTFDPVTKLATVDKPWCEVIAGDVDYTVFSARDGILLTEIEASEILAKEATVEAARKKAALAAALSA
jgi:hypothetical protein